MEIEYSKNMKKSLELVEKTREKRLELTLERMSLRDNEELLKKWHPDYKKEHVHYAALNRTATMLAKEVFRHFRGEVLEAGE